MADRGTVALAAAGVLTARPVKQGRYLFSATATAWGGGSAKLTVETPGGTYVPLVGATLSANGAMEVSLSAGRVLLDVSGATGVNSWLSAAGD